MEVQIRAIMEVLGVSDLSDIQKVSLQRILESTRDRDTVARTAASQQSAYAGSSISASLHIIAGVISAIAGKTEVLKEEDLKLLVKEAQQNAYGRTNQPTTG